MTTVVTTENPRIRDKEVRNDVNGRNGSGASPKGEALAWTLRNYMT
jgi:hypothetical protein